MPTGKKTRHLGIEEKVWAWDLSQLVSFYRSPNLYLDNCRFISQPIKASVFSSANIGIYVILLS